MIQSRTSLQASRMALALLTLGMAAPAAARSAQLLSVEGEVHVDGRLAAGPQLVPASGTLRLADGARVQLLLSGQDLSESLALAVLGPAQLRLGGASVAAELLEGTRIRGSGTGRLGLPGGWFLQLRSASAVLDERRLYLLGGRAGLRPQPTGPEGDEPGRSPGSQPVECLLEAGQLATLDGEPSVQQGTPPAALLQSLARFVAPTWRPALAKVTLAEVRRAEQLSNAERRAARETASCGCTESRGPGGAPNLGRGPGVTSLEQQAARLRVRVTGVPRSQ